MKLSLRLVFAKLVSICVIAWSPAYVSAKDFNFEDGVHYATLEIPIANKNKDSIEVTEYFSYGCPACYQFEGVLSAWKMGLADDVEFNRTPAIWNEAYRLFAETYYTAYSLGVLEQIHPILFSGIQNQLRRNPRYIFSPKEMSMFFVDLGVDPIDFARVFNSFGVRTLVQKAEARGLAYRATGVPAIIVNGKYRTTGQMAGSNGEMLLVTDYLIQMEREANQAARQ